jgi:hypothetical protein
MQSMPETQDKSSKVGKGPTKAGARPVPAKLKPGSFEVQNPTLPALEPLHDVNARCIEILVQAARSGGPHTLSLVLHLKGLLLELSPQARAHAARCGFLLVSSWIWNSGIPTGGLCRGRNLAV